MKKIIRLTESDIHKIIKESVKRLIREYEEGGILLLSDKTLDYYQAKEMAAEYGMSVTAVAGRWFENVMHYNDFSEGYMPEHSQACKKIPSLEATMYYNRDEDYYFLAKDASSSMIGFSENKRYRRIMKETKDDEIADSWNDFDAEDDYLRDRYAEDAAGGDQSYNVQQADYNGIISMVKQFGYDAEIDDGDPEGLYPPMLKIYNNNNNNDNIVKVIRFLISRGWELDKQYSGEYTRRGTVYAFRSPYEKISPEYQEWRNSLRN